MSNWDASSDEDEPKKVIVPSIVRPSRSKWEDEDADQDDQVLDSWSASEDEASKPAETEHTSKPPIRKKGVTKQKIAEREAAESKEAEERAAQAALDADPVEKRKREQAQQLAADMENARGLLGTSAISATDGILDVRPQTPEEFEKFANTLVERLYSDHGQRPAYSKFVESLVKGLCQPLKDLEVRKASSALATLANEKQKAQREADKGIKKKAKPALGGAKTANAYDTRAYNEALDDDLGDDDFM